MPERIVHILPEQVASQIAAGEVVERPASAVKELVENSLDSGAHRIEVEIERAGLGLIAVGDDGCAMGREDAIVSLRRHATSKIRSAADLESIRTMGFRGEALASLAAVSHLTMRARRESDGSGVEVVADAGEVSAVRECGIARGTRIEVRDLFFNTPARLKFMKTPATEQGAVADVINRIALANHAIAFRLMCDARTILDFTRTSSLHERARQVFGARVADAMLAFERAAGAGIRVHGLAANSQESFASARMIHTYVNGRPVRDRAIIRAIENAYQTLIPRGRHPAAVAFISLRPEDVDVNVHPMKTEVRFRNSGAVFEAVFHALRDRLTDQTNAVEEAPIVAVDGVRAAADAGGATPATSQSSSAPIRLVPDAPPIPRAEQRPLNLGFDSNLRAEPNGTSPPRSAIPMYSKLRVLGQVFAGYIALEGEDGMILVDQHAAHERVTFEKLRAEMRSGGVRTQAMLAPATVELSPARAAEVHAAVGELRAIGFDVEPFGANTVLLKGAPAVFAIDDAVRLLRDMIDSATVSQMRAGGHAALDDSLKTLACHGSVRVGRVLEAPEISALLEELDRTEFKTNCPHGRPVHISFARGNIERMFRR
jgi:DNA mismatch repair protein MutL